MDVYLTYANTYINVTSVFDMLVTQDTVPDLRMMLYNGDLDTACNYLGDYLFMHDIKERHNVNVGNNSKTDLHYIVKLSGYLG